jgi:hypothetical protein
MDDREHNLMHQPDIYIQKLGDYSWFQIDMSTDLECLFI